MKSKPIKVCELHGKEMAVARVPIRYGEHDFDRAWEVKAELFPNANSYLLGGCAIDPENPKFRRRPVCEECRRAEEKWREENPEDDRLV